MSNLEIGLSVALGIALWQLVRVYRRQVLLRHLFIQSSDWCARKIMEMGEAAKQSLSDALIEQAKMEGRRLSHSEAVEFVPCSILNAKQEWNAQADYFQATLKLNGITALGGADLDSRSWNPLLYGLKWPKLPL